jgi:hypothetical protein
LNNIIARKGDAMRLSQSPIAEMAADLKQIVEQK